MRTYDANVSIVSGQSKNLATLQVLQMKLAKHTIIVNILNSAFI